MTTDHGAGLLARALCPGPGDAEEVARLLDAADGDAPPIDAPGAAELRWVAVDGGEIRVLHAAPPRVEGAPSAEARRTGAPRTKARPAGARRPIVFVPGWGTNLAGWHDLFRAVHGRAELFYLETREKTSSRVRDRRADMSVAQSARDIGTALTAFGLSGKDFVLAAACWGATLVLQGMIDGRVSAPTVLLHDPMHTLWFPKWLLRWVSPLVPLPLLHVLRPLVANAMIGDMQEPRQKARAYSFVYDADFWKWKRSAEAARDFELYGALGKVRNEVFVLNGTADKVHDPVDYPRIAAEIPCGRFLHMPTGESRRELLLGAAALEFARVRAADGLPASLARFEKRLR